MTYDDIKIFFGRSPGMCVLQPADYAMMSWRKCDINPILRVFESWRALFTFARVLRERNNNAATPNGLAVRTDILLPTAREGEEVWGKCLLIKIPFHGKSIGPTLLTPRRTLLNGGDQWTIYRHWKELYDEFPVPDIPAIGKPLSFFDGYPGYKRPDGRTVLAPSAWEDLL